MNLRSADQPNSSDVLAVESRFFKALVNGDLGALDDALAGDFLIVEVMGGSVLSRADFLDVFGSRQVIFEHIETFWDDVRVREYKDTAIVVGRTQQRLTVPDGQRAVVSSRYTHVYRRDDDGQWRLASAQGTRIA